VNQSRFAGIDVSAKSLVVSYESRPGKAHPLQVPNTPQGHRELCETLSAPSTPIQVCLEATGNYSLDVALALHQHGIPVMILNPRAARDFAKALQNRSKTDAVDAQVLLEYAKRMEFHPWQPPSGSRLQLRDLSRRIKALTKQVTQEKNRLEAASCCQGLSPAVRKDIEAHLRYLQGSIDKLLRQALKLMDREPDLSQTCQRLISIKGVGQLSAVHLMAELLLLPSDMTARQWVAYAGLDPRHHESGSSVQKPTAISRTGNAQLRETLFMPALTASWSEPHVKAFYEKLQQRGKTRMQALVAVMRKLLHCIHGMLKNQEDFQGQKFFKLDTTTPLT
jgi:transposase